MCEWHSRMVECSAMEGLLPYRGDVWGGQKTCATQGLMALHGGGGGSFESRQSKVNFSDSLDTPHLKKIVYCKPLLRLCLVLAWGGGGSSDTGRGKTKPSCMDGGEGGANCLPETLPKLIKIQSQTMMRKDPFAFQF